MIFTFFSFVFNNPNLCSKFLNISMMWALDHEFSMIQYDNPYFFCFRCYPNQKYLTTFCSSNMVTKPHKLYGYGGCITLKVKSSGESHFKVTYLRMENSDFRSTCR